MKSLVKKIDIQGESMRMFKQLLLLVQSLLVLLLMTSCDNGGSPTAPAPSVETPIVGASISFDSTDGSSTTVSWGSATDNNTDTASLQYKIVMASSENAINTAADADAIAGSDLALDWTANAGSMTVRNLSYGTTYWFAVLVKDEDGNITLYSPRSVTTGSAVTTAVDTWSGNVYAGVETIIPAVNLLSNDSNNIGDDTELSIVQVKNPLNGTVVLDGVNIKFTASTAGDSSFIYVVQAGDDEETRVEATVTLTASSAPAVIASSDSASVRQGTEIYISAVDLLDNDTGSGLTVSSVNSPVMGTVSKDGSTITFTSTGIAGEPAQFEYTVQDDNTTQATGIVYITVTPLAPVEAYVYSDRSTFEAKKSSFEPPTVQAIFDTWARFDGNNYFENKDAEGISNNAAAWQLLTDDVTGDGIGDDRVSMPSNVYPYNGFVSPDKLENYTFEATLNSPNGDDDTIGLLIAFDRIDGVNHTLSAVRTQGGNNPRQGWAVVYGEGTNQYVYVIDEKEIGATTSGWSDKCTRVKIVRTGSTIECYTTPWFTDKSNPAAYDGSSKITVDLTDSNYPGLSNFIGAKSYGYMTYSQPYSTYLDISFSGGLDAATLSLLTDRDPLENIWSSSEVWKYENGTWAIVNNQTIQQELGYVRDVTNPDTGKTFTIRSSNAELK